MACKEQDNQDVLNWRKLLHAGELKPVPGKKSWTPAIAELLVCCPGRCPQALPTRACGLHRVVGAAGGLGGSVMGGAGAVSSRWMADPRSVYVVLN